ncbi:DNA polymerase III [Bacillus pumilus]|uniref:DNA polymerase III n=1 Tax=Bacillus TaxID=1386 RepID=UPI0011E8C7DA|nr:DNA polymerase III [Bacillus pumilus]TYS31028.1 DNA polymerase III [Bacillus pumilus]TYS45811.1 DNA polymerase III [Bacillus pumilus]
MSDLLYHAYFPESHEFHVSQQEVMNSGIKYSTKSNHRYSNGGRVKLEITENLRPSNIPKWINFKEAIGADIINRFTESFCFPIFTDKILVFDSEISLSIYDQAFYEDMKEFDEEALNFDTGETIEYWIEQYWKSMIPLKDYLSKRPYQKPEVLIFEPVPKEVISFCEE